MSTQVNPKLSKIVSGMVASGVPRSQAVAVATAIEHALLSQEYAKEYGTFLRDELTVFVDTVYDTQ
jgi:hypothetical protein